MRSNSGASKDRQWCHILNLALSFVSSMSVDYVWWLMIFIPWNCPFLFCQLHGAEYAVCTAFLSSIHSFIQIHPIPGLLSVWDPWVFHCVKGKYLLMMGGGVCILLNSCLMDWLKDIELVLLQGDLPNLTSWP